MGRYINNICELKCFLGLPRSAEVKPVTVEQVNAALGLEAKTSKTQCRKVAKTNRINCCELIRAILQDDKARKNTFPKYSKKKGNVIMNLKLAKTLKVQFVLRNL